MFVPVSQIPSQAYEEQIDDYITGVEQVGAEPTAGATGAENDAKGPAGGEEDGKGPADGGGDPYEFTEYDVNEYDAKGYDTKGYDDYGGYGSYGSYGPTDAYPTEAGYEDEFGPGIPAQTDIRESNVRPRSLLKTS